MSRFQIGDLITFTYPLKETGLTNAHDKRPRVLVLHDRWQGLTHGLNFNYLTDDEINMLRMMIDPGFQLKYFYNLRKKNPNRANEFERIIHRAGGAVITSPKDFYYKAIQPFVLARGGDPYRQYRPEKMSGVRVVQPYRIMTGQDKLGLFGTMGIRDKGRKEKDILKDLAKKDVEGTLGRDNPYERRFAAGLQGKAFELFSKYKQKFQAARGPRLPRFGDRRRRKGGLSV